MADIKETMRRLWESACTDKASRPSCRIENGKFIFTITGNKPNWVELCKACGVPTNATQTITEDKLICEWESYADSIFGTDGLMANKFPNYEPRLPQIHMARLVQRSIEMNDTALIEAGTGVGKSFAYAAIAMAMNKRIVISTSNKALQAQLYTKDIPFLSTIFAGKKVALVQGKRNYVCKIRQFDDVTGANTLTGDFLKWYETTESGNTEEIPFELDWKALEKVTVNDYCLGRNCAHYSDCFYYTAKRSREPAHVLICNHMMLAMHQIYPMAGILPGQIDLVVIDEAHKFPDYVRNVLGGDLPTNQIDRRISLAGQYLSEDSLAPTAMQVLNFHRSIADLMNADKDAFQIGIRNDQSIESGIDLAQSLFQIAEGIWGEDEMPSNEDKKRSIDAESIRRTASLIFDVSKPTAAGYVRWIETKDFATTLKNVPYDISSFVKGMIEQETKRIEINHTHCCRCNRQLTADSVYVLDGLPYGSDCIKEVDPFGDAEQRWLSEWLEEKEDEPAPIIERKAPPIVFCSATLASPDMKSYMRECGIKDALTMIAASPFDYANNSLLYIPGGQTPQPSHADYLNYLVDEIEALVKYSKGGAFVLFTSYKNMKHVHNFLAMPFKSAGLTVFKQGDLSKLEIIKRFKADGNAVLFATKSFWEGVSVEDDALRLVIIDKIPFPAPSPLLEAQKAHLKQYARDELNLPSKDVDWYPFNHLDVPIATLELKQGAGRLIRTARDRGVIAILDPRLRTAQYARRSILPALPPSPLAHNLYQVSSFFAEAAPVAIASLTPVQQFGIFTAEEAIF